MSRFLKVIVNIILVCAILTAAALLVPPLVGVQTFIMDDMGMQTNMSPGSVTYAVPVEAAELKNGDKLLEEASTGNYVYRVTNLNVQEQTCTLLAPNTSPQLTKEADISNGVSKVVFTMPVIGYVVMAMQTMEGLIIIGLAVLFLVLLFVLSEIWKKDDDDDEDEDEEEYDGEEYGGRDGGAAEVLPEDEDEGDDEDEGLSRRELKRRRKEEKAARKAAKRKKDDWEDQEDMVSEEEPEQEAASGMEQLGSVEAELASIVRQFNQESSAELDGFAEKQEPAAEAAAASEAETAFGEAAFQREAAPEQEMDFLQGFQKEEASGAPVMPNCTVEELLERAKAAGAEAELMEDKEAGVTLVDYSGWLKKK